MYYIYYILLYNSLVNRKINEDPSEYKFVCTLHEGRCKKYFKTEKVRRRTRKLELGG